MTKDTAVLIRGEIINPSEDRTALIEWAEATTQYPHPVTSYLESLKSEHSRKTQRAALASALACLKGFKLRELDENPGMLPTDPNGDPIFTERDRGYWHNLVMEFPWWKINRTKLNKMISSLAAVGYAPNSVSRTMSAVKRTMEEASLIENSGHPWHMDPGDFTIAIRRLTPIKAKSIKQGQYTSPADWAEIKKACDDNAPPKTAIRDKALLACGYLLAMRISEPAKLNFQDYDSRNGFLTVREAKGGETRTIPVGDKETDSRIFLDAWVRIRGKSPGPLFYRLTKEGHVLPKINVWSAVCKECEFNFKAAQLDLRRNTGQTKPIQKCPECGTKREAQLTQKHLTCQALRKVNIKRRRQAGLRPDVWHSGRRSFAADSIHETHEATAAQRQLGHKDFSTTASYDNANPEVYQAGNNATIRFRSGLPTESAEADKPERMQEAA